MKRLCTFAIIFAVLVGFSLSASAGEDFFTVTNVQGDKITVKSSTGQMKTLVAGSPNLKVGDTVKVVGNKAYRGGSDKPSTIGVKPPAPQKNLPFDDGSKAVKSPATQKKLPFDDGSKARELEQLRMQLTSVDNSVDGRML